MSTRGRVLYLSLGTPHLEYTGVVAALRKRGVQAEMVHLHEVDTIDWKEVGLVNVRMCRGYPTHPDFLHRLEVLHDLLRRLPEGPVPMINPIRLVREAVDKAVYLRRLADAGTELVPTRWIETGSNTSLADLMDDTGWDDVVVKPTVSAGSWRTTRVSRAGVSGSPTHLVLGGSAQSELSSLSATHEVCVQQFLPSILTEGEYSFVFLGGLLSHTVLKTVGTDGGWWAHERLGGVNHPHKPSQQDEAWARSVFTTLERLYGSLPFGRVDGIRSSDGELLLLECELAIPRLLLPEGRAFDRYADVIAETLERPASLATA